MFRQLQLSSKRDMSKLLEKYRDKGWACVEMALTIVGRNFLSPFGRRWSSIPINQLLHLSQTTGQIWWECFRRTLVRLFRIAVHATSPQILLSLSRSACRCQRPSLNRSKQTMSAKIFVSRIFFRCIWGLLPVYLNKMFSLSSVTIPLTNPSFAVNALTRNRLFSFDTFEWYNTTDQSLLYNECTRDETTFQLYDSWFFLANNCNKYHFHHTLYLESIPPKWS